MKSLLTITTVIIALLMSSCNTSKPIADTATVKRDAVTHAIILLKGKKHLLVLGDPRRIAKKERKKEAKLGHAEFDNAKN